MRATRTTRNKLIRPNKPYHVTFQTQPPSPAPHLNSTVLRRSWPQGLGCPPGFLLLPPSAFPTRHRQQTAVPESERDGSCGERSNILKMFCPLNRNAFSLRNLEKQKFENLKIEKSLKKEAKTWKNEERKSKKSHKKLAK